jgi:hypothetical protein
MSNGSSVVRRTVALFAMCPVLVSVSGCPMGGEPARATEDIAQEWMTLMLDAQEYSAPRPTVLARQLWYVSAAMYEAWAAYDATATGYFTGHRLKVDPARRSLENRAETLSHAVYPLLSHYYAPLGDQPLDSSGRAAYDAFAAKMRAHGYLTAAGHPTASEAQALGALIAEVVLEYAAADGSNEAGNYADTSGFTYLNPPLIAAGAGVNDVIYPDLWQTIMLPGGVEQRFLTPHWGRVSSFALPPHTDAGPLLDPGPPPMLESEFAEFVDAVVEVIHFSAGLDPIAGPGALEINISPAVLGNNPLGTNDGAGHELNPVTRAPYPDVVVKKGDWLRCVAEFWADGPHTELPPGHWGRFAIDISSGGGTVTERAANKPKAADLEYDVKLFFMLNAAMHDAAVASWDLKAYYNYVRPITAVRYLAEAGLLPITEGYVEVIDASDPLAGELGEYIGDLKIFAWLGPDQGCGWMRGAEWLPYQPADFVTPGFPGYTSGHSAFSRAAAEILTRYTQDPYFPGGLGMYEMNSLRIDGGVSEPVPLMWATYYDAADEAGQSRLMGGIHVRADDFGGRVVGAEVGHRVFEKATDYFEGRGVAVAKTWVARLGG